MYRLTGAYRIALHSAMKNWKPIGAGLVLFGLGLVHSIWPNFLKLDWQGVALLALGAAFCFASRLSAFMRYVKKLKVGEAEIELREASDEIGQNLDKVAEGRPARLMAEAFAEEDEREPDRSIGIETQVLELAAKDREAALIRLAIEIERQLALLCKQGGVLDAGTTWRKTVEVLVKKGAIEPALGQAIIEFRDVRNQVIHSGLKGPVRREILARAIDQGLKILLYFEGSVKRLVSSTIRSTKCEALCDLRVFRQPPRCVSR
jgi:hypothetical protein